MIKHPVLGSIMVALGGVSIVVQLAMLWRWGPGLLHWAPLFNVIVGIALVSAGVLMVRAHPSRYKAALVAWALVALISLLDLALQLTANAHGSPNPWVVSVKDVVLLVISGYFLAYLWRCMRTPTGGNANAA
jgi:hypothetical protein